MSFYPLYRSKVIKNDTKTSVVRIPIPIICKKRWNVNDIGIK